MGNREGWHRFVDGGDGVPIRDRVPYIRSSQIGVTRKTCNNEDISD